MDTLYDLLGALPRDDAESLRTAFRKAVKGAHPDLAPGDPDAALKFRQIIRANEILGDTDQRAAYDDLLELARQENEQEHVQASRQAIAARIHKLASGVIAVAGAAIVTVGGYLLFMHMSAASVVAAGITDVPVRASSAITAAVSPEKADDIAAPTEADNASSPAEAMVTATSASPAPAENVPAASAETAPEPAPADRPDPQFPPAYIDRGTIFYRLRNADGGFPDIAPVKRIEKPAHPKPAPVIASRPPHIDQAAIPLPPLPPPFLRRRVFAQDPSRLESYASARLR
jgi:curved DNA-binding protein CbpA